MGRVIAEPEIHGYDVPAMRLVVWVYPTKIYRLNAVAVFIGRHDFVMFHFHISPPLICTLHLIHFMEKAKTCSVQRRFHNHSYTYSWWQIMTLVAGLSVCGWGTLSHGWVCEGQYLGRIPVTSMFFIICQVWYTAQTYTTPKCTFIIIYDSWTIIFQ